MVEKQTFNVFIFINEQDSRNRKKNYEASEVASGCDSMLVKLCFLLISISVFWMSSFTELYQNLRH